MYWILPYEGGSCATSGWNKGKRGGRGVTANNENLKTS